MSEIVSNKQTKNRSNSASFAFTTASQHFMLTRVFLSTRRPYLHIELQSFFFFFLIIQLTKIR